MDQSFLSNINAFYESAWNKLIFVISILFIILGVLVPIIVQILQNWSNKREKINQEKDMKEHFKLLKEEFIENTKTEIETDLLTKLSGKFDELEIAQNRNLGHTFFIQGNMYNQSNPNMALGNYILAITRYIAGKDEMNLQRVFNAYDECIIRINLDELKQQPEYYSNIVTMITGLEKINTNGRYTDRIRNIKKQFPEYCK
jgi:hypothetical protein